MADTMIVGRTIGVTALAAVGCTGSLSFFIIGFVNGFTSGLAVITAQRFGAKDMEGVKKSFATGILLTIFLSIGMTILAVLIARPVLELLQTPAEILDDATSYITIIFVGTVQLHCSTCVPTCCVPLETAKCHYAFWSLPVC